MLKLQLCKIKVSFRKIIVSIEHRHNTYFYATLYDFVSRRLKQHIAKEFERVNRVDVDKVACGLFIRTAHGLPDVVANELLLSNS